MLTPPPAPGRLSAPQGSPAGQAPSRCRTNYQVRDVSATSRLGASLLPAPRTGPTARTPLQPLSSQDIPAPLRHCTWLGNLESRGTRPTEASGRSHVSRACDPVQTHGHTFTSKVSCFGQRSPRPPQAHGGMGSWSRVAPGKGSPCPPGHRVLDADGEALRLGRPLPDQVGPAGVRLEQVVRLLPLHVARKPSRGTRPGVNGAPPGGRPGLCDTLTCTGSHGGRRKLSPWRGAHTA